MNPTHVHNIFGGFVGKLAYLLGHEIPVVLAVAAGLIGLGILVHYVRKWIGSANAKLIQTRMHKFNADFFRRSF